MTSDILSWFPKSFDLGFICLSNSIIIIYIRSVGRISNSLWSSVLFATLFLPVFGSEIHFHAGKSTKALIWINVFISPTHTKLVLIYSDLARTGKKPINIRQTRSTNTISRVRMYGASTWFAWYAHEQQPKKKWCPADAIEIKLKIVCAYNNNNTNKNDAHF